MLPPLPLEGAGTHELTVAIGESDCRSGPGTLSSHPSTTRHFEYRGLTRHSDIYRASNKNLPMALKDLDRIRTVRSSTDLRSSAVTAPAH